MTANTSGLWVARGAIVLGVVGSLAGNTAWAYPHPVLVGVGVFMSLVLPISVALWRATGERQGWQRLERAAVMGFITAGAATYTLVHAGMLLHDQGLDWPLAVTVPLVGESLVVMAARALSPQAVPAAVKSRPARAPRKAAAPATSEPLTPDDTTLLDRARDLVAQHQGARYGRGKLAADLGVSQTTARNLLEQLAAESTGLRVAS